MTKKDKGIYLKKKRKIKKDIIKFIFFLSFLAFLFLIVFLYIKFFNNSNIPTNNTPNIKYQDYYYEYIITKTNINLYEYTSDSNFKKMGEIKENTYIELEKDSHQSDGYFKLKNLDYYIYYENIEKTTNNSNNRYTNYIPFDENAKTINGTKLYDKEERLLYTLDDSLTFDILVKDEKSYGVIFNNQLLYINTEETELIKNNNNLKYNKKGIAVLTYHFTYDLNDESEVKNCKQIICLSNEEFHEHMAYIKGNDFYTATLEDLELYIDGKVRLPEKTVVITIDDGYFVKAAIKVLEELNIHATLFLIGTAGNPEDYASKSIEIHSHTYAMHYTGACEGGQGSPLKCLNKSKLLDDLKISREQLNNTTYFCWPFFEYNDYAISVIKEAGFTMALAGGRTKVKVGTNKMIVPRYGIINTTTTEQLATIIN